MLIGVSSGGGRGPVFAASLGPSPPPSLPAKGRMRAGGGRGQSGRGKEGGRA